MTGLPQLRPIIDLTSVARRITAPRVLLAAASAIDGDLDRGHVRFA